MRCQVLLFAQLRDAIGRDRIHVELDDNATVSDLMKTLAAEHAVISSMKNHIAVAVEERYAKSNDILNEGCTVALIPPVSGG